MWCMYGIFSVKSEFLGSTTTTCKNTLWCKPRWVALSYSTPYTPYVKGIKRFKNYFDTNSKFPWIRIYPRRGLREAAAATALAIRTRFLTKIKSSAGQDRSFIQFFTYQFNIHCILQPTTNMEYTTTSDGLWSSHGRRVHTTYQA